MLYLVCYDISSPKRLRKTAKTLENFGLRIQKSFFQCEMEKKRMESLRDRVLKIIDTEKDYFFVYPLCEDCSRKALTDGKGELIRLESFEIL
ncbi:MAG: CRISPR-associated endonuclease Cas2 [Deltaproteobacteria bacterium]|nr:MAG: CRISPR-associated endonuclease Cas2 [Deltaproteobacteria bacterium]